jgi:hypothetical protein
MLNPQRSASECGLDSISLPHEELRPVGIVVHNQNAAGQWFQRTDCVSTDLLLCEWWVDSGGAACLLTLLCAFILRATLQNEQGTSSYLP